jgi:hypothetical protein
MTNFNVWTMLAYLWPSNVTANRIVMMEAMSWAATFHCQTVPKANLSAKECSAEWVVPVDAAFFSDSDAMETMTAVIGQMRKIAPRKQSAAHQTSLSVMMVVAFHWDGGVTKNRIATQARTKRTAVTLATTIANVPMMNILAKTRDVFHAIGYVTVNQTVSVAKMKLTAMSNVTLANFHVLRKRFRRVKDVKTTALVKNTFVTVIKIACKAKTKQIAQQFIHAQRILVASKFVLHQLQEKKNAPARLDIF